MGIELVLGLASLAVGVIGGVAQASAANAAADAQKKANDTANAQQTVNSLEDQRQRIREDRVRRAAILNQSEAQGTQDSSGETGAVGALDTNFSTLNAQSAGQSASNATINKYNQAAADATAQSNLYKSITGTVQSGLDTFGTIFNPSNKNTYFP